jgi:farnesyl diphosphate synthase
MSYGRQDEEHVSKVREIFKGLAMVKVYKDWEKNMVVSIKSAIENIDEGAGLKKEVFTTLLYKILSDTRKQFPQC